MKTIVEVNNLTKFYGKNKVLSNVTLKIQEKEIVGLIGPNGAGKSTLMKCLTSLVFFQEGKLRFVDMIYKSNVNMRFPFNPH